MPPNSLSRWQTGWRSAVLALISGAVLALGHAPWHLPYTIFAAVPMLFMQHFDVDHSKVNVNGGAIAMGHPLGATGAMIIGQAMDELDRSGKGTALATLCVAGGMGAATIIEKV